MGEVIILNTPLLEPVLCRVFNYAAPYYNVSEYGEHAPTVWEIFCVELEWEKQPQLRRFK